MYETTLPSNWYRRNPDSSHKKYRWHVRNPVFDDDGINQDTGDSVDDEDDDFHEWDPHWRRTKKHAFECWCIWKITGYWPD